MRVVRLLSGSSPDPSEALMAPGGKRLALSEQCLPNIRLVAFCCRAHTKREGPLETELVEAADYGWRRCDAGRLFVGQVLGPGRRPPSVVQQQTKAPIGHQAQSTHDQRGQFFGGAGDPPWVCLRNSWRGWQP